MSEYRFPSTDELRDMYRDVFSNQAVTELSRWTDSNSSDAIDEKAYLKKALETGAEVISNMRRAIEEIGR